MADDTRQREDLSKEALTIHPEHKPFSGSQWDEVKKPKVVRPPESANLLAGGTENTAGGKIPDVTLSNAFDGGLKWSDFTELPKKPCVRDAFMTGIGAGFALGGTRAVFGAAVWTVCNWTVGSWALSSAVMYQWCLYRRHVEKDGMMRAVEILNKKEMEKKAREQQKEQARAERRRLKDAEQDQKLAALREASAGGKPWWKVW